MFLDIKMPKILGTEFLRSLSHPPKVIFVTAYREYAVDGFELEAVDYLVKPVSFERFLKAINRLKRSSEQETALEHTQYKANPEAFIFLKDILYAESWKDYVTIHFTSRKQVQVKQTISAIGNMLSEHMFLRVHRSYIVSLNKISGYNSTSLRLGGTEIPIGRLYKQNVNRQLQQA
jgi:DNA-binding LytR/AlgR family response regulator